MVSIARDMMLTVEEYMALRRLIDSERESEGASVTLRNVQTESPKPKRRQSAYSRKYKRLSNHWRLSINSSLVSGRKADSRRQ